MGARRSRAWARATAIVLITGCSTGSASDGTAVPTATARPASSTVPATIPSAGPLTDEIAVEVEYVPNLALFRSLEVSVDNAGARDVTIAGVTFRTPLFVSGTTEEVGTVVGAGRTRDMELDLGEPQCPAARGSSIVDVAVVVDGVETTGSFGLEDPERLDQLNTKECGQRAVFDRVAIELVSDPAARGAVLPARFVLTRQPGIDAEPLTVAETRGTLVFSLRTDATPDGVLATMDVADESTSVDITLEVNRCDVHTVSQSATSFEFPLWVAIADGEPQYVLVKAAGDTRVAMEALIQECLQREAEG